MEIKLLIFDLDGVLLNTGNIHFVALNQALDAVVPGLQISMEQDLCELGAITSANKLQILTDRGQLDAAKHKEILQLKKELTLKALKEMPVDYFFNKDIVPILEKLATKYELYVASNTNQDFILRSLKRAGILHLFSEIYCNADVRKPKPDPEIYSRAMLDFGCSPQETVIFEDSAEGQEAAIRSGAHVFPIESPADVNEAIFNQLTKLQNKSIKWKSKKINVLIPMAGEGSRFKTAGFKNPKPMIDVNGQPMVGLVADKLNIDAHFIFVVKGEHCQEYNLETILPLIQPECTIVKAYGKQCGAACSILEAKAFINNDEHLLIVNSDQIWEWDANAFYYQMIREDLDGGIITFVDEDRDPKWSFARVDENGYVQEVAEKKPISNLATAGIYYYKHGSDFVKYAEQMIEKEIKVNGEYYTAPVYNEFVLDNKKIKTFNCKKMIGMGVPEDLSAYLKESNANKEI